MNILCTICSDVVNQAENIYVTKCGHIFHHLCLAQWIERSKTCPQCRNKVTDKCMFRLYPTVSNENSHEDAATLQSRLDDAQLQLRQQRVKYKEKEDKLAVANADLKRQDDLLKSYEKRLVSFDSKVLALREQLEFVTVQNKDMQKVKDENEALKKNMQTLNGLQKVLNATSVDVEQMLHSYTDVRTIATFATALKRALCDSEAKKNESRDKLHAAKQQLALEKKTVSELQNKVIQLEDDLHQAQHRYDTLKKDTDLARQQQNPYEVEDTGFTKKDRTNESWIDSWVDNDDIKDLERKKKEAWLNVLCSKATRMNQAAHEKEQMERMRKRDNELRKKIRAIVKMKNEYEEEKKKRKLAAELRPNVKLVWNENQIVKEMESDSDEETILTLEPGSVISLSNLARGDPRGTELLFSGIRRKRIHPKKSKTVNTESTNNTDSNINTENSINKDSTGNTNKVNAVSNTNTNNKVSTVNKVGTGNIGNAKHSIFHKKEPMKIGSLPLNSEINYDGLGGHSKLDTFPVANPPVKVGFPRLSAKHKLKRPNPTVSGSQDIEKMLKKVKNN